MVEVSASHINSLTRSPLVSPTQPSQDLSFKLFSSLLVSLSHIWKSGLFACHFHLFIPLKSLKNFFVCSFKALKKSLKYIRVFLEEFHDFEAQVLVLCVSVNLGEISNH